MASAFLQAMDSNPVKIVGENGAAELSTTTDPRLDLFFALVRNLPEARLHELVKSCFAHSAVSTEEMTVDMFLLAFQTRDCRGGKGERSLFQKLFFELASRYPQTAIEVLPLIPKYGYYKDLFLLAGSIHTDKKEALYPLRDAIITLATDQLAKDMASAAKAKECGERAKDISLLAKWAPREGGAQKGVAKLLAAKMFPDSSTSRAQYRKALSELNALLGTVEVKMCANSWEEIEPTGIPSLTLMRNRKAFLNEKVKGVPSPQELETGNRLPLDANRVACRKRVREALVNTGLKKLKGKQLFPHEICKELMNMYGSNKKSIVELEIFNAQWEAIRTATKDALNAKRAESVEATEGSKAMDLGKLVSIVDVSGSMDGIPMEVAIALGILVSELSDPAFANRVITFHDNPSWCKFEAGASIAEKVKTAQSAPWGGSTNFVKSLEMILDVAVKAKLNPEDIPNLIVFSDMQFNQADRNSGNQWETHYERIVRRFHESGMKVCGRPWPAPEITFWNLRGDTVGFPVDANAPNVRLLSGFSPSLLKLLLAGESFEVEVEEEVEEEVAGGGVVVVKKKTKTVDPLSTLRKALDDATYDDVRVVLSNSKEGALGSYSFTPAVAEAESGSAMADEAADDEWEEVKKE